MSYKILIEKEYNSVSTDKPRIGCLMMVKNEEKRIHVSLDSVTGTVDCLIIYDTGSVDNTIEIIKKHCEKHELNLYMIQGDFVNFSVSRNISLDYADTTNSDFLLLLDTNDELREGEKLKAYCKLEMETNNTGYLMNQHWWSGKYDTYYNTRLIKARKGWRYNGSVHEYMKDTSVDAKQVVRMPNDIILYQDRTKDNNKSGSRFARDKILLLADYKKDPTEPRTLFYLAQTCACLGHIQESFDYYNLRTKVEGFQEEKFHAFLRSGELSQKLNHNWHDSMAFYMKAVEHTYRVEPLNRIVQHYIKIKKWDLAYTFIKLACNIVYPTHAILFVNKHSYDYTRWHLMGIIAYYCKQYNDGKIACMKAIEVGLNVELDKKNLEFYVKKEQEQSDTQQSLTKNQFVNAYIEKLKKQNNKLSVNILHKQAIKKWKNRHKK